MTARRDIEAITQRIAERSKPERETYLDRVEQAIAAGGPHRRVLSCGNLAHGFAACAPGDKAALAGDTAPNLGIITAYNDMLSAHQPFETFPAIIREAAREAGGVAQEAGGVPAMSSPWPRRSACRTTCSTPPSISASATRSCRG
jgi:phosphogluconate dehydratase